MPVSFSEYFTELLATSKLKFHKLFHKTYGIIYERNSDVFIDFFRDLEDYYDHGEVDLEGALRKFLADFTKECSPSSMPSIASIIRKCEPKQLYNNMFLAPDCTRSPIFTSERHKREASQWIIFGLLGTISS